jgi:glyoxylase-like metal-dependent hydrolase (beta-lactamase superfamily II)
LSSIIVGDFRITHVRAGSYWWDGGAMFGVVPKTLWSKTQPADELNRIEAGLNCFVIEDGDTRILVETGIGVRLDDRTRERIKLPTPPVLTELLATQGFEPDSFDTVINTHLHWDHVGGNTVGGDMNQPDLVKPAFPRAWYVTQEGELEHARQRHPRDSVSYRPVNYEPLIEAGQMRLINGTEEVSPGVTVRVAQGHNRDMMVVMVQSKGESWIQLADLVQYAAQVTPTWVSGFDLYPLDAIDNKTQILGWAAGNGTWCSFGHDPKVAFAKIQLQEGKWEVHQSQA